MSHRLTWATRMGKETRLSTLIHHLNQIETNPLNSLPDKLKLILQPKLGKTHETYSWTPLKLATQTDQVWKLETLRFNLSLLPDFWLNSFIVGLEFGNFSLYILHETIYITKLRLTHEPINFATQPDQVWKLETLKFSLSLPLALWHHFFIVGLEFEDCHL